MRLCLTPDVLAAIRCISLSVTQHEAAATVNHTHQILALKVNLKVLVPDPLTSRTKRANHLHQTTATATIGISSEEYLTRSILHL
jgi:hypothetical protein